MPLMPGQILNNRYRTVRFLVQGGMGAVSDDDKVRLWGIPQ